MAPATGATAGGIIDTVSSSPPRGPFGHGDPDARGPFGSSRPTGDGGGPGDLPPPRRGPGPLPRPPRRLPPPSGASERRTGLPFPSLFPGRRRPAAPPPPRRSFMSRITSRVALYVLALVGVVALYVLVTEGLPRWWAEEVGGIVYNSTARGVVFGLLCGVLFTLAPLYVLRYPIRPGLRWSRRLTLGLGVLMLALPNLLTLSIQLGSGVASIQGRRIFDVNAPGFRGASLFGVLAALVAAVLWQASRDRDT